MNGEAARVAAAAAEFRRRFGRDPEGVWAAPGRVNLIGEHTDHNDGFVLPVAIDRSVVAALGRRADGRVRGWSAQLGPGAPAHLDGLPGAPPAGWIAYVAGVAWALREAGPAVCGLDVVVDSDVPVGAGLASSAALTCAVGLALAELVAPGTDRTALALAARRAEREVVGAPVGIMDQAVALLGVAGHALLLDCRTLSAEHVPLGLGAAGLELVVIGTGVTHAHATGGYAGRRRECAAAATALGVATLREARPDRLDVLDPVLRRRARHVVTENARVLHAADLLRAGRAGELGPLLSASHASLRDDFEVSVPELDAAVAAATHAGALGARMTGGGFGGSALALVPVGAAAAVGRGVRAAFERAGFAAPSVFTVRPAQGAGRRR